MKKTDVSGPYTLNDNDEIILPDTLSAAKKSEKNVNYCDGYLCDDYLYEGNVTFSRDIEFDDDFLNEDVFTLKLERTRMTKVYINDEFVGEGNSLCSPHYFDITEFIRKKINLKIEVSNVNYPTKGGHMTSPDTQTNWLGILGEMSITGEKKGTVRNITIKASDGFLLVGFDIDSVLDGEIASDGAFEKEHIKISCGKNTLKLKINENAVYWSEFTPKLYKLKLTLSNGNEYEKAFGIRKLSVFERANKSYGFKINGIETIMRGKHDGMIFPKTGYAPTDKESWLHVMGISKSYGINHYRFHTCTPPDAAFEAADELGIYLEPELPFWGTIAGKDDKDCNLPEQEYLINEGIRIIKEFSHHPSFVMMSMGNELWGSADRISEIIGILKALNDDILYTGGSNNFQFFPTEVPNEDFFAGVRFNKDFLIRGSYPRCDAPLGFVQTEKPNTTHDYDIFFEAHKEFSLREVDENGEIEIQYGTGVKKVKVTEGAGYIPNKPVVSHEVGQYVTYPDYDDIPKYTGVLKPHNFEIFKNRLEEAGMGKYARDNFVKSGKLAVMCYKLEIEAARRSKCLSGYQLLDIQDFTGQGTATVGILNSFMESKGIISREEWLYFNAPTVIMASFDSFVIHDGENFEADIIVSHFGGNDISKNIAEVDFLGKTYKFSLSDVNSHGVYNIGKISAKVNTTEQNEEKLVINMGETKNEYTLFLVPMCHVDIYSFNGEKLLVTSDKNEALNSDKDTLLITDDFNGLDSVYCTDIWCFGMFSQISRSVGKPEPAGTLGISADTSHEALKEFKNESFTTPKWYDIITNSRCMILDKTDIDPIIRTIDNVTRNHKLSLLFEAREANRKIIVLSMNKDKVNTSYETAEYVSSVCKYALSDKFNPVQTITKKELEEILK